MRLWNQPRRVIAEALTVVKVILVIAPPPLEIPEVPVAFKKVMELPAVPKVTVALVAAEKV